MICSMFFFFFFFFDFTMSEKQNIRMFRYVFYDLFMLEFVFFLMAKFMISEPRGPAFSESFLKKKFIK